MTKDYGMHPFFLVMTMVAIGGGLGALYRWEPASAPVLFALSVVGLLVRVSQVAGERRRDKQPAGAIDFAMLRAKDLERYVGWLKENIRGHDAVIDSMVRRLQQGLSLAGPNRTLGNFILVGPTGTGKTFVAELLAKALYPGSEPLILRMNQFKHAEDVFTLLGPPPGMPGYEVGGALTRPVLENPYRVVLLDEMDKCHHDVRDCLFNVLDTGRCQEKSSGRMVSFNACALIATTNAGVEALRTVFSEPLDRARRIGRARDALAQGAGFEKAFLARFDEIFLMDELSPIHVAEVACLQIAKHWKEYGIEVSYASPEILVEAMRKNVEFREYGVRQLSHLIQTMTDASIERARQGGIREVRLDIDRGTGQIKVVAVDGA